MMTPRRSRRARWIGSRNINPRPKVGDKSWVVELAIPIDQFNQTATASDTWTFNFLRNRMAGEETERSYWSPISGSAHSPEKFGTLTGMPTWKDRAIVTPKKAD